MKVIVKMILKVILPLLPLLLLLKMLDVDFGDIESKLNDYVNN